MNYYELLGVSQDADVETIRRAYRSLAKTCHPDACKAADAEERFKLLGAAVDILCDPTKRYFYDLSIAPRTRGGDSLFGTVSFGDVEIRFTQSWPG